MKLLKVFQRLQDSQRTLMKQRSRQETKCMGCSILTRALRDTWPVPVTLFHVVCTCGNNQLDVRTRLRWDSLGSITLDWRKKNAREGKWTDKKTFVCYRLHYSKRRTLFFFLLDHSFTSLWKPCWGWESSSRLHGSSLGGPSSNAGRPMFINLQRTKITVL